MLKTLHGKLALALGALLLFIALLLVPLTLYLTRVSRLETNQHLNRQLAANLAASKVLVQKGRVSRHEMDRVIDALEKLNPGIEAYVLNPRGDVLAYPISAGRLAREQVDIKPLERFLNQGQLPIFGDDPLDPSQRKVFSVARLTVSGKHEGYIYIVLDSEGYESASALIGRSYAVRIRILATLAVLLCALAAGAFVFSHLTRRLTRLSQAMEDFQERDFRGAVAIAEGRDDGDEIDSLAAIFSRMERRIEEQFEDLRRADTQRREFVSNASHDLRTPLTALRGYLETLLLKEGQLSPDEQRHYIQIAVKHGERLSALVEELFELSKLDALQAQPRTEPFPLGELIQDVAQKYQLRAQQSGVQLQTQLDAELPFVGADIGLIERVLENLIENALRYTPDGGSITLALRSVGNRVRVQVIDSGSGIATEDLPYVFDRFYRARSEPNASEKSGAGLGLSIARRAVQLHDSDLSVQSAPGKGATFTFDLLACEPE